MLWRVYQVKLKIAALLKNCIIFTPIVQSFFYYRRFLMVQLSNFGNKKFYFFFFIKLLNFKKVGLPFATSEAGSVYLSKIYGIYLAILQQVLLGNQ